MNKGKVVDACSYMLIRESMVYIVYRAVASLIYRVIHNKLPPLTVLKWTLKDALFYRLHASYICLFSIDFMHHRVFIQDFFLLCIYLVFIVRFLSVFQASLHDLITKNIEKIKKPRNSNADNMY